ncbi:MAG: hypothetical protein IT377_30735 [Polyangiaceae bacterium]|nr:hypothetical protein [Polyangiaceae bacterium]
MSTALALLVGAALGALGALGHLSVLWLRVQAAARGRPGLSLLTYPLSLGPPAAAVLGAASFAPAAAWAVPLGLLLCRTLLLRRLGGGP